MVAAADRALQRGSFETAARVYRRSYVACAEARQLAPAVLNPKAGRKFGLAASLLTGGFGLEDLIIFPLVNGIVNKLMARSRDSLDELHKYVAINELVAISNAPAMLSDPRVDRHLLERFYFLYTDIEAHGVANERIVSTIQSRISHIELSVPELNELLLLFAQQRHWDEVIRILGAAGYHTTNGNQSSANGSRREDAANEATAPMSLADAYALLGVSRESSADEVRAAYLSKIKQWHPDKLAGLADELQRMANERTKRLNEAYELIQRWLAG